jgi:enoyl-CoA hydratase
MGTFLLLACDVRLGARGTHRMGLNEVAIRITPPGFAIELARTRLHPAWLSRTVTLGEMYEPDEAAAAGFLDRVVEPSQLETTLEQVVGALAGLHLVSHVAAKIRLRAAAIAAMRQAIEEELTETAYLVRADGPSSVKLPGSR